MLVLIDFKSWWKWRWKNCVHPSRASTQALHLANLPNSPGEYFGGGKVYIV
jgi:hypothetical protein